MKGLPYLIGFILALGVFSLIIRTISTKSQAQSIQISEKDYAVGTKRAAAVASKVTPALKEAFVEKELTWGSPIFLRAFKEEKVLELWVKKKDGFVLFESYPIAAASGDLGPKKREGDRQVPEGFYFVKPTQMNPQSRFHLAFNIGYPNNFDRAHERTGSAIMVHGSDVSIGCLAMTDAKVEEIYTIANSAFDGGQPFFRIHLFPFRMTKEKMAEQADSEWHPFWRNLQTGYQWFEEKKTPPNVTVKKKNYFFE